MILMISIGMLVKVKKMKKKRRLVHVLECTMEWNGDHIPQNFDTREIEMLVRNLSGVIESIVAIFALNWNLLDHHFAALLQCQRPSFLWPHPIPPLHFTLPYNPKIIIML